MKDFNYHQQASDLAAVKAKLRSMSGDRFEVRKLWLSSKKYPGLFAYVDADLYDELNKSKWRPKVQRHTTYAQRDVKVDGKWTTQKLHRLVMELRRIDAKADIDHCDSNGLNNCSFNLQPMSNRENNRGKRCGGSSEFTGVSRHKRDGKWRARIWNPEGKQLHLGLFHDEVEAANAYDTKAIDLYGDKAKPNFPDYFHLFIDHDYSPNRAIVSFRLTTDARNPRRFQVWEEHARFCVERWPV